MSNMCRSNVGCSTTYFLWGTSSPAAHRLQAAGNTSFCAGFLFSLTEYRDEHTCSLKPQTSNKGVLKGMKESLIWKKRCGSSSDQQWWMSGKRRKGPCEGVYGPRTVGPESHAQPSLWACSQWQLSTKGSNSAQSR